MKEIKSPRGAQVDSPKATVQPIPSTQSHAQNAARLLQRYASGTRHRVVGTRNPEEVFALASEVLPQIIVLDVMMPDVDGWELLGRLRQHPLTAHIPVIVCTILPQEEPAFTLGASDFMQKPVGQQVFLQALDRHSRAASSKSH